MWKLVMYRTHYPGPDPAGYCHFCLISGSGRILIWKKKSGSGSGRIIIWKKVRIRFRPDSNLKKKFGSGSGRILIWKKVRIRFRQDSNLKKKVRIRVRADPSLKKISGSGSGTSLLINQNFKWAIFTLVYL